MRPPRQLRPRGNRLLRWVGLAAGLLVVVVVVKTRFRWEAWVQSPRLSVSVWVQGRGMAITWGPEIARDPSGFDWNVSRARHVARPLLWWPSHEWKPGFSRTVWMPFWTLLAPPLALAAIAGRCRRPGVCPACSYSLAGLAHGSACPECGADMATKT